MTAVDAPYKWPNPYDDYLQKLILAAKADMEQVDDDRLYICVGPTGSGKSMLSFHIVHLFAGDSLSLDHLAGTRESFACKVKDATDKFRRNEVKGLPLWFDEADSDNLEQNAKWNKKLFALYMKIRFLRFFHIWCWPSLRSVDRRFVEERVNGIFFCYTKEKNKPRRYAYFSKSAILSLIEEEILLNYHNLRKYKDTKATWLGYFRDYNGPLKNEYLASKHQSGYDTVDDFYDLFSNNSSKSVPNDEKKESVIAQDNTNKGISLSQVSALLNTSKNTLQKKRNLARVKGIIPLKDNYTIEEWRDIQKVTVKTPGLTIKPYVQTINGLTSGAVSR